MTRLGISDPLTSRKADFLPLDLWGHFGQEEDGSSALSISQIAENSRMRIPSSDRGRN